jgi:hypothetical protein
MIFLRNAAILGFLFIGIPLLHPTVPSEADFTKGQLNLKEFSALKATSDRQELLLGTLLPGFTSDKQLFSTSVTVTSYNPLEKQCDDSPLIDSNNKLVMPGTIAIPQEYRKKIGIILDQTVMLEGYGLFTVTGHMNDRFKDEPMVDIISFIPKWSKRFGRKYNVKMYWW